MDIKPILAALKAPFPASVVKWRAVELSEDKTEGLAVPYIDARDVQNRLDEVVGAHNWESAMKPTSTAIVGCIRILCNGHWVSKEDGAQIDHYRDSGGGSKELAVKGAFSDALKRAAVQWGIGRYLYAYQPSLVKLTESGEIETPPDLPFEFLTEEEQAIAKDSTTSVKADAKAKAKSKGEVNKVQTDTDTGAKSPAEVEAAAKVQADAAAKAQADADAAAKAQADADAAAKAQADADAAAKAKADADAAAAKAQADANAAAKAKADADAAAKAQADADAAAKAQADADAAAKAKADADAAAKAQADANAAAKAQADAANVQATSDATSAEANTYEAAKNGEEAPAGSNSLDYSHLTLTPEEDAFLSGFLMKVGKFTPKLLESFLRTPKAVNQLNKAAHEWALSVVKAL